ncbi:RNA-dependent DNA polymerase [Roseiflexus castenholzii]|jgi:RNA-directed DNA polymerase|uniref:RNA-directed DNA polymerase (Reverse transcriptase) n=1 Tax=Roseiflexus castenholzii (strain DSM 13941 / HLO8) TaxID=383372 RepID=A7NMI6_ROSCS|nr:RNA-dependent DNA polymerase [Roseiflexus castenholzii]ABU58748.1 RNA-directed DNA polymerase (Reverse transcriptase) [Roseiflexus castenholzii DSM 13941]
MPLFPRYNGPPLLPQICSVENLTLAWRRVRSNIHVARRGRSAGPDAVTLRDFEADWTRQMAQLADELQQGTYRPLPAKRIAIPKASGGERAIAILSVRDRVAQRAVQQVLDPLFDPCFLDCSYGCRPHVGVPEAVARVQRYADQGLGWVVDADIAGYFDAIDQRVLLGLVRQRIDELPVLKLIAQWLEAGMLPGDAALPDEAPATPLQHGEAVLRQVMSWGAERLPPPPTGPYAAAAWEMPGGSVDDGWTVRRSGLESHLWTAMMLARPAIDGARRALPYLQRIGARRLAVVGAVAVGALALSEAVARMHTAQSRGTPQGGALSPLLANIYLHPFDVAMTSQGFRLARFVDDFVIMCATQDEAERALNFAQQQLRVLRLELNAEKTRIASYANGIEFLGASLAPRAKGQRLGEGLVDFADAERVLRDAMRNARQRVRRKIERGKVEG